MRIVYVAMSQIPSTAANSVHVMKMCEAMADRGHDVTLVARPGVAPDDPWTYYGVRQGFALELVDGPRIRGLGVWLRSLRIRRRLAAGNTTPTLLYGRDARTLLLAGGRTPRVLEVHAVASHPVDRAIERLTLRSARLRRLVFISSRLRDDYVASFPAAARYESRVVPDAASPHADAGAAAPIHCPRPVVGYVGHLYPGRGIELLLEVARRRPDLHFVLVGGSDDDLARHRAAAPPNAHLVGRVRPSETGTWLAAMDIFVAPYQPTVAVAGGGDTSRWMSPLKVFEYMAHGKPIVASDLPVLREVLAHDRNCLLVPPVDADAWGAALSRLAADPELRSRLGRCALQEFEERYTWTARADAVLAGLDPGAN